MTSTPTTHRALFALALATILSGAVVNISPTWAATSPYDVGVFAKPTFIDPWATVTWSEQRVISMNTAWDNCPSGICPGPLHESNVHWAIYSSGTVYIGEVWGLSVCAHSTATADVEVAARELLYALPTKPNRTLSSGYADGWSIGGGLYTCDGRKLAYLSGGRAGPVPSPMSCVIVATPEIDIELESGRHVSDADASIACSGIGRASAKVNVVGSPSVTPVQGLTVSTKVPTSTFIVTGGATKPIKISVTVDAKKPAPGRYQSSFVYVVEFI